MKIKINLEEIKPSYDKLIDRQFTNVEIPICLGSMCPPLIKNLIEIEDTDFFVKKQLVEDKDIDTEINISRLTNESFISQGKMEMVITKEKSNKLEKIKEDMVASYREHVYKCITCTYVDICDKLTTHYRENIKLLENN